MSNNHEILPQKEIENKIYNLRGAQVMLDKDLAAFYGVKAIRLREQIKRNPNRFPDNFVFQLDENEVEFKVSQNAIPSKQSLGGGLSFAFTEQGLRFCCFLLEIFSSLNHDLRPSLKGIKNRWLI